MVIWKGWSFDVEGTMTAFLDWDNAIPGAGLGSDLAEDWPLPAFASFFLAAFSAFLAAFLPLGSASCKVFWIIKLDDAH